MRIFTPSEFHLAHWGKKIAASTTALVAAVASYRTRPQAWGGQNSAPECDIGQPGSAQVCSGCTIQLSSFRGSRQRGFGGRRSKTRSLERARLRPNLGFGGRHAVAVTSRTRPGQRWLLFGPLRCPGLLPASNQPTARPMLCSTRLLLPRSSSCARTCTRTGALGLRARPARASWPTWLPGSRPPLPPLPTARQPPEPPMAGVFSPFSHTHLYASSHLPQRPEICPLFRPGIAGLCSV